VSAVLAALAFSAGSAFWLAKRLKPWVLVLDDRGDVVYYGPERRAAERVKLERVLAARVAMGQEVEES